MGAGVIPFAVSDGEVYFLFQMTFTGRKVGFLIDFGGGLGDGEDYRETAIREFVEETETMYFSNDVQKASRTIESVNKQIPIVEALFDQTLNEIESWHRRVRSVRSSKGYSIMWKNMKMVRDITFSRVEPVHMGEMTHGVWEAMSNYENPMC